jgi:hypothetical protein
MSVQRLQFGSKAVLRHVYSHAQTWWRDRSAKGREIAARRAHAETFLDDFARGTTARFSGTVLVDGMWDNPNYWLRYSLLRAALGLAHGREIGITGLYKRAHCRKTFERFGFRAVESFPDLPIPDTIRQRARNLVAQTRSAADILKWDLPVHPAIVYDGILKLQRLASVDISHPQFAEHVQSALESIERAQLLLDRYPFDLVVISHPLNFTYGAVAWLALARGIPVILPFGAFGTLRFTRFKTPDDMFRYHDRPGGADIAALPPEKADALAQIGRDYLASRLQGRTGDLASQYAFQRNRNFIDRDSLCKAFGWDPSKPIVGFYASNWYDWPHQLGMTQFRDFLDWTQASYQAACANTEVNWLFKPHPAEEWFGGISLSGIFASFGQADHIRLADRSWNNAHVLRALDALITYHGTGGIEFASMSKPVLVPDRGNYDDCGFVKVARSREDYIELLGSEWWHDIDHESSQRRAEIFAGWWFCMPEWQGDFVLADDAKQDALYASMPDLIGRNAATVEREVNELQEWWQSGRMYYHTGKMANAQSYRLSNTAGEAVVEANSK